MRDEVATWFARRTLDAATLPAARELLPLLRGQRVSVVLPALDEAAGRADRTRPPIDGHVAAFLAARVDAALAGDLVRLTSFAGDAERLSVLRLFARLQTRLHPGRLPGLAGWLVASGLASVADWRSQKTRATLQDRLLRAAADGQIGAIVAILDDEPARLADKAGAERAAATVRRLQAELGMISADAQHRTQAAQMLGHEAVTGTGLVASLAAAVLLALQ